MKHIRFGHLVVAFALAFSLLTQGVIGASASHQQAGKPTLKGKIVIGQIASQTGAFSIYAQNQIQGFKAGLEYATKGTMKIDKAKIVVKTYTDIPASGTNPDPATAVTDAKNAIQNDGVNILQCCTSSASALAVAPVAKDFNKIMMVAPANADSLSGINRNTFRTSRMALQDAATGAAFAVKKFGKNYIALAQDYVFGHDQVAAWKSKLDKLGANDLEDVYFPLTTTDFTPYIQRVLAKNPQWVFLACAGAQCVALAKALDQAGVLDKTHVMTGLGNIASFAGYGESGRKLAYISVYYYKFPKTKTNDWMVKYIRKHYNRPADIFDQDSFAAAQQLVAALKKTHSLKTSALIKALEGQTVQGPKGPYTIRKADHACLQVMYTASLGGSGDNYVPKLLGTLSPKKTAPPIQKVNW